jgi:phage baseplate assembly protein W
MGLIDLRVDGVSVPSEGLVRRAEWVLGQGSPYKVREGQDTLSVYQDHNLVVTDKLPSRIYTQEEMRSYLSGILGQGFSVSLRGKSVVVEMLDGRELRVEGSLLRSLGQSFEVYVTREKVLFPSWRLVKLAGSRGHKVLLSKSYISESILDMSYTTEKSYCRRCGGTGVENDILFDEFGSMKLIGGYDLLYQRIAKCLLTELGSNPYHSFYGSNAMTLIGQKVSAGVVISLRTSVQNALDTLIDVQTQQSKVQEMSLEERVKRVRSIDVSTVGNDETSYLVRVSVESFSMQPISVNVLFTVPGAFNMDGELR